MSARLGRAGRRWLLAWLMLALVVVGYVWALLSDWLPRPTAEEASAVLALQPPAQKDDRAGNAFAWLLLAEFRIDAPAAQALLAESLADQASQRSGARLPALHALAGSRHRQRVPLLDEVLLCRNLAEPCLDRVSAELPAVQQALVDQQEWLDWALAVDRFDHLSTPALLLDPQEFKPGSWPGYRAVFVPLSSAAADFAAGQRESGLQGLCRYVAGWRRLLDDNDSMLTQMLGIRLLQGATLLRAQMAAMDPTLDSPACGEAFEPLLPEALPQCPAMRSEYQLLAAGLQMGSGNLLSDLSARLSFNRRHSLARMAITPAYYCQPAHDRDRLQRVPAELPSGTCNASQSMFNPHGCMLAEIARGAGTYQRLERSRLDLDATLRLLGASRWLRERGPAAARAPLFAELPPELRSPAHRVALADDGRAIRLELLDNQREAGWTIPIDPPQQGSEQGASRPED